MFRGQFYSVFFGHKLRDIPHGHALFDWNEFVTSFAGENSYMFISLNKKLF